MHLSRIDGNGIACLRFNKTTPTHGFLRTAQNEAYAELVMTVPTEGMWR